MSGRDLTGHDDVVNYIEDFVGADIPRNLVRVALVTQDNNTLDVTTNPDGELMAKVVGSDGNRIADIPLGKDASSGDEAILTKVADALQEVGNTQLRVDLQNNNAGTLAVEQQTAVSVENSAGTTIDPATVAIENALKSNDTDELVSRVTDSTGAEVDPLARADVSPVTGSTSTAGNNVALVLGDYRKDTDFFVDVSGSATLTVEVRITGGTWREIDTIDYGAANTEVKQYSTSFAEIRARVDQNLNTLEASAKGT
jgi:hypothetical protein